MAFLQRKSIHFYSVEVTEHEGSDEDDQSPRKISDEDDQSPRKSSDEDDQSPRKKKGNKRSDEDDQSPRKKKVNKKPSNDVTEYATPINPSDWLATFYHFSLSVYCALLLYYGNKVMAKGLPVLDPNGVIPEYGGRFKFLTHNNQWLQLIFFTLQFLTDILPKSSFKRWLQDVCDIFFTALVIPVAFFVVFTFWTIYAVDRRLVYPERFDLIVPAFLNHFWHTAIAVWVLLESVVCFHCFPTFCLAVSVIVGFYAAYLGWIVWVFVNTEFWVYPILQVLPLPYLVLFFSGCMLLSVGFYFLGKAICHLRWGTTMYLEC